MIILFSFITIIGLMAWRFVETARRDTGLINIIKKGWKLDPALVILSILVIILYLWNVLDAYTIANRSASNPLGLLVLLIVIFFILG